MTVDTLLKKMIADGYYTKGDFMCLCLNYIGTWKFWQWGARLRAHNEIQSLIASLSTCRYATLSCALCLHYFNVNGTYTSMDECTDLCMQIYSNWDNRFKIIAEFVKTLPNR